MTIPTLEGARVRLEPLGEEHSLGMFHLWREPSVCEYGPCLVSNGPPFVLPAPSVEESDRLLQLWRERAAAGDGFRWAVLHRDSGEFVGALGFNVVGACSELAFHFIPKFWGRGLANEASRLALAWVFEEGAETVEAIIEPGNDRSVRAVERLGFVLDPEVKGKSQRFVRRREPLDLE